MSFVLVHGGGFDHRCWDPLVPLLDGEVHAVDLPGRGVVPPASDDDVDHPSHDVTIADSARSVVDAIEQGDVSDVVLVGHSLAGITLPAVADRVPDRVKRLVFVAATVPPQGSSVADVLGSLSPATAEVAARIGTGSITADGVLHRELAMAMFCNDMTDEQIAYTLDVRVPEVFAVVSEPVDLAGLDRTIPRTYIRLLRDQSLDLDVQSRTIDVLGGPSVVDVVDIDASHMAMIARPFALAAALNVYVHAG